MANTQTVKRPSNLRQQSQQQLSQADVAEMGRDFVGYLREYVRENPETAAAWCFGIGFILGWKLKIW